MALTGIKASAILLREKAKSLYHKAFPKPKTEEEENALLDSIVFSPAVGGWGRESSGAGWKGEEEEEEEDKKEDNDEDEGKSKGKDKKRKKKGKGEEKKEKKKHKKKTAPAA